MKALKTVNKLEIKKISKLTVLNHCIVWNKSKSKLPTLYKEMNNQQEMIEAKRQFFGNDIFRREIVSGI